MNTNTNMSNWLPSSHVENLIKTDTESWWQKARIQWAARLIRPWINSHPTPSIINYVDLGCGSGGFPKALSSTFTFKNVALVDGDVRFIESLSKSTSHQILERDFSKSLNLPWSPHLITCMDVIEHLESDSFLLKEAFNSLQPGGLLVVSVPAHQWLFSSWDTALGHYRRYSRKELINSISEAGFEISSCFYMWSFLNPVGLIRKWKNTNYDNQCEFPKVPKWINTLLLTLSSIEWTINRLIKLPLGTSVIIKAVKPHE